MGSVPFGLGAGLAQGLASVYMTKEKQNFEAEQQRRLQYGQMLGSVMQNGHPDAAAMALKDYMGMLNTPSTKPYKIDANKYLTAGAQPTPSAPGATPSLPLGQPSGSLGATPPPDQQPAAPLPPGASGPPTPPSLMSPPTAPPQITSSLLPSGANVTTSAMAPPPAPPGGPPLYSREELAAIQGSLPGLQETGSLNAFSQAYQNIAAQNPNASPVEILAQLGKGIPVAALTPKTQTRQVAGSAALNDYPGIATPGGQPPDPNGTYDISTMMGRYVAVPSGVTSSFEAEQQAGRAAGKSQDEIVRDWNTRYSATTGVEQVVQPDGTVAMQPVTHGAVTSRGGFGGGQLTPPPAGVGGPSQTVGGRALPPVVAASKQLVASEERAALMHQSYNEIEQAAKNGQVDSQGMLNLLSNHLGMTAGIQQGARLNQALWDEAMQSAPWLDRILSRFTTIDPTTGDHVFTPPVSGVVLTEGQMKSMLQLADDRLGQDRNAYSQSQQQQQSGFGLKRPSAMAAPPMSSGSNPTTGSAIYARDPQGKLHKAAAGTPLPQGWTQAQAPAQ